MFAQLTSSSFRKQRGVVAASLVAHAVLFAWLLRAPEPRLLNPNSVGLGHNGRVVGRLYFPSENPDDSTTSSPQSASEIYRHQRLGHEKLIWKPNPRPANLVSPPPTLAPAEDKAATATLAKLGHGVTAGLPFGTLPGGPVYGEEIRPALPITTADPVVYPCERPTSEGKVVIEITIDERGVIIRKTVLQSLGPAIDNKCLAALENWRFQPATQNGAPIASKQDAIFPFKARG